MTGTAPTASIRLIANIKVGKRHRRDLGDIEGLARSIAEIGALLHPIVVRTDGMLVAGERRLAACKLLGWDTVPVTVVDLDKIVRGEFAENAVRKDFTLSEAVAIKHALEPAERAAAKQRQAATLKRGNRSPVVQTLHNGGKTRDRIAAFTGVSHTTLARAEAIVAAAEAEPDRFSKLLDDMDRTGRVNGVYRRLNAIKQSEAIRREPPPLPGNGPYRVIVADPPWTYEKADADPYNRGTYPYPAESIANICALDVAAIAHKDCILWLWVTNHHMREAFGVIDAWGFEQKTILTWAKPLIRMGHWLRGQTEHCLMATRGNPTVNLTNESTLLHAPVGRHSEKPAEFYELVERLCPAPRYAELFARQQRPNWDGHGDEVNGGALAADDGTAP